MIPCIHGRSVADPLGSQECLDCAELAALRELETCARGAMRVEGAANCSAWRAGCVDIARQALDKLDEIRRAKGIGALGHPETRDLEGR